MGFSQKRRPFGLKPMFARILHRSLKATAKIDSFQVQLLEIISVNSGVENASVQSIYFRLMYTTL